MKLTHKLKSVKKTLTKQGAKLKKVIKEKKMNKVEVVEKPQKKDRLSDWETMMSVVCPVIKRPRRTSPHTIAAVTGRTDIHALVKEMEKSGKCFIYRCPDVKCYITYLDKMRGAPGMIHTPNPNGWKEFPAFEKDNPYPIVKGFKRFASGTWSGGAHGKGKFQPSSSAMNVPYEKADFPYAREVIKALKKAGYTPGITEDDLYERPPCPDCDGVKEQHPSF